MLELLYQSTPKGSIQIVIFLHEKKLVESIKLYVMVQVQLKRQLFLNNVRDNVMQEKKTYKIDRYVSAFYAKLYMLQIKCILTSILVLKFKISAIT